MSTPPLGRRSLSFARRDLIAFMIVAATLLVATQFDRFLPFSISRTAYAAAFTPGNIVVYRVGSGTGSLLGTGNPVFLDEFTPSGTLVQSIAMPVTTSLPHRRLVANGIATSEGLLTRSVDGQYLILTGYDVTPPHTGNLNGSASASVNRVIGRVDAAGTIDTTTALSASFSGGNIRSAISTDGNTLWASGSNDGVRTTTLGSAASSVVGNNVTNLRQINIFGTQLYVSSASGSTRIATVGTGTPTSSGQIITNIPGSPTASTGPYGYFFADLDAGVAGVDTLYIADDTAPALGKHSLVGGTWVSNGTVGVDGDDYRGLTATVSGTTVTLYATRLGSSDADGGGELVTLVDASGYNGAFTGTPTLLSTAVTNTAFRGVALVPSGVPPTPTPTPSPTPTPTPTLSINDVIQTEGDSLTSTFTFTVSLTSPATSDVFFDIATADGTAQDDNPPATEDNDYVAKTEGRSITTGSSSASFTVTVNGDTTTEPNETFFVNITNVTGGAIAGDVIGQGTINNDDLSLVPIYTIQGSGMSSDYAGTSNISTSGIVTARKTNGFFLQDPTGDGNDNTSDGIFVFTSSAPGSVEVGNLVQVTGTIVEFESSSTDEPDGVAPPDTKTLTEISSPTINVIPGANPLPAAVSSTSFLIFDPVQTSRGAQLEKYESMRISVSSITVCEPTNGFAEFYGVESPHTRPYREPGIEKGDPVPAADQGPHSGSPPPSVPVFDGNFERVQVDTDDALIPFSTTTRRTEVSVTTGAVVTSIVGPLDYAFDSYRIVLDHDAVVGVVAGVTAATPVPTPLATEFTIASANLENFSSGNMNFTDRLNKASLAIRNVMRTPDILGVIEVANQTTLDQLATKINADVGNLSLVNYDAFLGETAASQDIGFLVNLARVTPVGTPTQHFVGDTFTYAGATDLLHDRPPYILTADVPQDGGGTITVTVILNHTKSLIGVDSPRPSGVGGTEGGRNREKRRQQAEDIADLIAARINLNLVMMGDLNAFDFNDGLGDVIATMRGVPTPAAQVVEPTTTDPWNYVLTNLSTLIPATERYSFAFEGNAQALDHILVNNGMLNRNARFAYARYNGDFSESFAADANRPERLSDHDAAVAYFSTIAPTAADASIAGWISDANGFPVAGTTVNLNGSQTRKTITNARGYYEFDNVETNGFYTVTPSRANYNFSPSNRSFSQLGNHTEAAFTGSSAGDNLNPLDTPEFFVRQQYVDVLGREPDEGGFNYWSNEITNCGADAACVNRRRRDVAAAFFIEDEFQNSGSYIYDAYKGALGRKPVFSEYSVDRKKVVGGSTLDTQKAAFAEGFVARAEFVQKYQPNTTADSFVDALLATASQSSGVDLSGLRTTLLAEYQSGTNTNQSRSLVLQELADNAELKAAEYNAAFVLTEYFSYLQRNPEPEGYDFWLNVISNRDVGNYRGMVCSFVTSTEYQKRFSSVVTHSNAECGN